MSVLPGMDAGYESAVAVIRESWVRREHIDPWVIGDCTLEICPMGQTGRANGSKATLELLSDDTGVPFKTLQSYRWASSRWMPSATRVALQSWEIHRRLAKRDDRFELIRTLKPHITLRELKLVLRELEPEPEPEPPPGRADDALTPMEVVKATAVVVRDRLKNTWLDDEEGERLISLTRETKEVLDEIAQQVRNPDCDPRA